MYNFRVRQKKIIISLAVFVFLFGLIILADRLNIPETTDEVRALAVRTVLSQDKAVPPNDFIFDGCTLFPEIILDSNLIKACLAHDISYWAGGTPTEKKAADLAFKLAVAESGQAGSALAPIMYFGCYLFGDTWLTRLFTANWSFGYNK